MHLSVPAPRLPALHAPTLAVSRLPIATVLLTVLYAVALGVALAAPGQHALAGCVVLAGLVSRAVVRRHRSPAGAVTTRAVLPADAAAAATAA